jgi:hypothetical protein
MIFWFVIWITLWIEGLICLYAIRRNIWVFDERNKLIKNNTGLYKLLPPYKEMVEGHGFWHWNIEYYINKGKQLKGHK